MTKQGDIALKCEPAPMDNVLSCSPAAVSRLVLVKPEVARDSETNLCLLCLGDLSKFGINVRFQENFVFTEWGKENETCFLSFSVFLSSDTCISHGRQLISLGKGTAEFLLS